MFPGSKKDKLLENPTKVMVRVLARAGLEPMRIHDLRQTFAAICVNLGASLYEVQKLPGLASPTLTQRYAHLVSDNIWRA